MGPEPTAALVAALSVGASGLVGAVVIRFVARRSTPWASALVPVVVVLSIAIGVVVTVQEMYLVRDLGLLLVILGAALPIALAFGVGLSAETRRLAQRAMTEVAARAAQDEAERARRALVAGVSHDLRTPLAGIRALAESISDGVSPDPRAALGRLVTEADRLDRMVSDLLELSRLQAREPTALSLVDVRDLVSDALATATALAGSGPVRVSGHCPEGLCVEGVPDQLARVLDNLVVNAVRHTSAGSVDITATPCGDRVHLAVRDSCGGIPAAALPHVFDAGFQESPARTPTGARGAGLGLAVAREIVAAHDGSIEVSNTDVGCCFEVSLPAHP